MTTENKPSDKVDLASTELKIGGVNLKGSYIVWFFAAVSAVGGGIYGAGQVWGEYQALIKRVDSIKMPDGEPLVKLIEQVEQLDDVVGALSQSIAENQALATKIASDQRSMQTLIEANDVSKIQGAIAQLRTGVEGVQVFTRDVQLLRENMVGIQKDMASLKKDVDSQWNAIDSIGAGALKGGK